METKAMLMICILATTLGCQSFSSTMLNRLDDNSLQGNSNGFAKLFKKTRPYKGIPITLKVPSHVDVFIEEDYYMAIDPTSPTGVLELLGNTRLLNVRTEIIKTDKVFTVDFKRPGSGTLDLKLKFSEEQYFKSIVSKIQDTTIVDTAALAAQVIDSVGSFAKTAGAPLPPDPSQLERLKANNIMRDTRTVAYQRFDINAVDFELQVEDFVNRHLNECNQCSPAPTYDPVNYASPTVSQ